MNDLFFDYERGQKLGLWVLAIDSGLLLGPTCEFRASCGRHFADPYDALVGGFLNLVSAAWINWFNALLFATLLVLEIFLMPETLYPRRRMLLHEPPVEQNTVPAVDIEKNATEQAPVSTPADITPTELPRTKSLPFLNMRPVPGMRHPKPWDSITRFVLTFQFPAIVIAVLGYSFVWYWWILSVITMVPAAYVNYTPLIQGLLFLGLFLGTIISEICCSGRLSDYIVEKLAKRNGNIRVAEMRLWLAYPAILITSGEIFSVQG